MDANLSRNEILQEDGHGYSLQERFEQDRLDNIVAELVNWQQSPVNDLVADAEVDAVPWPYGTQELTENGNHWQDANMAEAYLRAAERLMDHPGALHTLFRGRRAA